ncbi:MAG: hypothetical protein ACI8P9_004985 [Parasphingorhabdus sp.]|jgi:hypothetical protein
MYKRDMTSDQFLSWENKAITLMGMSGVGKTTLGNKLPGSSWYHYSGDYRLGTRYMDEAILDNIKLEAMRVPFLAELLRTDSIYICHNITINNLNPISSYLGKIGDPAKGGLDVDEFKARQSLHMVAETAAMFDMEIFLKKAREVYGFAHFVNDAGGSLCELGRDDVYEMLARRSLIVYLKASDDMLDALINRALVCPKPIYYRPEFLDQNLAEYLSSMHYESSNEMDPDDFVRWIFPRLVKYRLPRYENVAAQYGVTIDARRIQDLANEGQVIDLICEALDAQVCQTVETLCR